MPLPNCGTKCLKIIPFLNEFFLEGVSISHDLAIVKKWACACKAFNKLSKGTVALVCTDTPSDLV